MIYLTATTCIQLAIKPVDFRCQIDGLVAICEQRLKQAAHNGVLYVFINRARTMIRILCYQDGGYWLATKRLSRGRYRGWPKQVVPLTPLKASELMVMLKGLGTNGES